MPGRRLPVLFVFFCGYVLGFLRGHRTGKLAGAKAAMLGIIRGYAEGVADRG